MALGKIMCKFHLTWPFDEKTLLSSHKFCLSTQFCRSNCRRSSMKSATSDGTFQMHLEKGGQQRPAMLLRIFFTTLAIGNILVK